MELSYCQAIILGIIQGLTEFLPVSSSGHLVMLQHLFGLEAAGDEMKLFDLAVHIGTVIAIIIYYRKSIRRYLIHLRKSAADWTDPVGLFHRSPSVRFTVLAIIAIFATGIFYILFKDIVEQGFEKPIVVAICWLVTATLLLITDKRRQARKGLRQFAVTAAILIGLAQGIALFPGISRSGSTICVAVLLGLHRRWAGEFSFLIGVPTILGAALLKGISFFSAGHPPLSWGPVLIGTLASTLVGLGALAMLIWALRRSKLKIFAIYCYALALGTFAVLLYRGIASATL